VASAFALLPTSCSTMEMLHVKPVPPTPSVSRQRPYFTNKGKASGLAVHVSSVAAHLGNTITGWLLSELTAKSAQENLNSTKPFTIKKADGSVTGTPKAVFFTPKVHSGPVSPSHLGIPIGKRRPPTPNPQMTVVTEEEIEEDEDITTTVELPRVPPPARTSPPLPTSEAPNDLSIPRKRPAQFHDSLPIAPKQLLPPIPTKSKGQRKPTPIVILRPPSPNDELDHLPSLPSADKIPYSSVLDSEAHMEFSAPPAPIVPSSPRFDSVPFKPQRPKFRRTLSSTPGSNDFKFDFAPSPPQTDDFRRSRPQRKTREQGNRKAGTSECMQDFVNEYVEMRRRTARRMGRNQRFPVAGQLMHMTDVGSVYALSDNME
jgi:hypothetical protein